MKLEKYYQSSDLNVTELSKKYNISTKVMELLLMRGFKTQEEVDDFLTCCCKYDPYALSGMREIVERLKVAVSSKESVLVFGDYDVDGVSATAIMLKTLKRLGLSAKYYLPNRYFDGYGLTNQVIDKIKKKFNPSLIITVDCGISCKSEIDYAKSLGIEIVVTDHHEIPEELPNTIIVNPKLQNQEYPFNGLCGTGVAYKISEALLGAGSEEMLPIAAIATIADIVPLLSENRRIVAEGLKLFEKLPLGLKMLFRANKVPITGAKSTDVSFKISPKLNASGRMGDAADSLLLYLETDPAKLKLLVDKIHAHNLRRQELCHKVYLDAKRAIEKTNTSEIRAICLASKTWDHGILGIVCSRLLEEYNRPVFLFSYENDTLKGSGRSIPDVNIHSLLCSMQDILDTFGGHTMAAGVTLKRANYEEFVRRVNAYIFENIDDKVFMPISYYDAPLKPDEITPEFLKDLDKLEPFGCGNPKPKFFLESENVEVVKMRNCPQHSNITVDGRLCLTFFNCNSYKNKLEYFDKKLFTYEVQSKDKGVVSEYESGRHLNAQAGELSKIGALSQLEFLKDKKENAVFKTYPKAMLLDFVTGAGGSAFGTIFVATSHTDYENFVKDYDQTNIYNTYALTADPDGFNSLILSPLSPGLFKNYNKIIFLSPVLDMSYISKINSVTNAEIFLPGESIFDYSNIKVNSSRENLGRIFKAIKTKVGKNYLDLLDFISALPKSFTLSEVYLAYLVFEELGIIKVSVKDGFKIAGINDGKTSLASSKIFNMVNLLKDVKGAK